LLSFWNANIMKGKMGRALQNFFYGCSKLERLSPSVTSTLV
jgi:hypothetical protein